MLTRRVRRIVVIAATVFASVAPAPVSQASVQYAAGAAVASAPVYDASLRMYTYKCTFAGWAHVTVNWTCRLKNPFTGTTYQSHSGSFSGGSASTPLYYFSKATGGTYLCTYAYAAYNDGSASDSDTACN